jgi:hypothetical protein
VEVSDGNGNGNVYNINVVEVQLIFQGDPGGQVESCRGSLNQNLIQFFR